ncbi:tetratricopeptide repeat protein [Spirulina sp. CS-785/01]|uniref:tetratricopeptide repeat protein n=1 Tax=Spirulina sp. CS-785/01 TaxID=3021716 RepID=UPI00232C786C|nr:tetratricopeptide repeat protein [Spirulina sp. CS-785/01]MDB9311616.1 tetratricopeptide repeat protein [Spirulina sp. CS-785/01]
MAKNKKTRKTHRSAAKGFGMNPSAVKGGIIRAEREIAQGNLEKALEQLIDLDERYPDHAEVLELLALLSFELDYLPKHQEVMERLAKLRPHDFNTLVSLGGAYWENDRFRLALDLFRQVRKQFPTHPTIKEIEATIAHLETQLADIADDLGIELDEQAYELIRLHEKTLSALETGRFGECRDYGQQVLELNPDFLPAWNNMAMAYWLDDLREDAIAITQKAFDLDPNNIHALGNMIQYQVLEGHLPEAQTYKEQFTAAIADHPEKPEHWLKGVEILSFLEDDDAILDLLQQVEAQERLEEMYPVFYHHTAVALMNKGQEAKAKAFWEQAVKEFPGLDIARENLEDLKYPVGFRNCPWRFPLPQWVSLNMTRDLFAILDDESDPNPDAIQTYLEQYPQWNSLVPQLLRSGDHHARLLALRFANAARTPPLVEAVRDFALSQLGPDKLRYEAASIAVQEGYLVPGEMKFWFKGEWQTVLLLGIELHDQPYGGPHSPKVQQLLRQGTQALRQQDGEKAEQMLNQALQEEPEASDLNFNLAIAYQMQGRQEETLTLLQKIFDQSPDYPFARTALAKLFIDRKQLDLADTLLKPMITWKAMHFQAFSAFCQVQIELKLAQKRWDLAKSWLKAWREVEPEHPNLEHWEEMLQNSSKLGGLGG